jgi:hypothetical protein
MQPPGIDLTAALLGVVCGALFAVALFQVKLLRGAVLTLAVGVIALVYLQGGVPAFIRGAGHLAAVSKASAGWGCPPQMRACVRSGAVMHAVFVGCDGPDVPHHRRPRTRTRSSFSIATASRGNRARAAPLCRAGAAAFPGHLVPVGRSAEVEAVAGTRDHAGDAGIPQSQLPDWLIYQGRPRAPYAGCRIDWHRHRVLLDMGVHSVQ